MNNTQQAKATRGNVVQRISHLRCSQAPIFISTSFELKMQPNIQISMCSRLKMQSITYFTNMNGFRTQDAVLDPKMLTLLWRKQWGVGIKISVWKREGMKKFLWWGRGDENLGWGVLGGEGA